METVTVNRMSILTFNVNTMELPMSEREFELAHAAWKGGMLIQNAFPTLSPVQREFLMSGMSEAEQDEFFGDPFAEA
jgi:hypothetical protein